MRLHLSCQLIWIASLFLFSCQGERTGKSDQKENTPLNILFILADDLGWMDVSYMGSKLYETPNIDALADQGMRFLNAYAANPLCSPTRASILTGLYPARTGIIHPACHLEEEILKQTVPESGPPDTRVLMPNSLTRLSTDYFTLGEAMQNAGYATGHFGKWHLGPTPYDALNHGFDVDLPNSTVPGPVGGYFSPWVFWEVEGPYGENIEDRMADEAVKFIRENKKKPFFLNYWCFSVHTPIDAKREVAGKYYYKLKELGKDYPQQNGSYAAKVETMDNAIGKLVAELKKQGLFDNTIIIFFSDNGGYTMTTTQVQTLYYNVPVTSNYPLRHGKASIYEGGTRVPMFVIWPGVVEPNSICQDFISSVDMYPTILDMLGISVPGNIEFDGLSITPSLEGGKIDRKALFTFKPFGALNENPAVSVRRGQYKLIRFFHSASDQSHIYELYDLDNDISETNNLAEKMPDLVKELDGMIDRYLMETDAVVPIPNPDYHE